MKKIKNYIEADLAKKKVSRYKYWAIKDESGIIISTSDDESSFSEMIDKIMADNVDAEVSVKFGTTEQSARQNAPFFIKINEDIEWVEPEEETVNINGQPHKVDKNGNVNISLSAPEYSRPEEPKVESAKIDYFRQEMDMQLSGLRREYELKEEKWNADMQTKLAEQMLQFKEMMLSDRENRLAEREAILQQKESELFDKEQEMKGDLKGYLKQVPSALGGVIKELISDDKKDKALGKAEDKPKKKKERRQVNYSMLPAHSRTEEEELDDEDLEEEIRRYEEMENEEEETADEKYEREFQELLRAEQNTDKEQLNNSTDEQV